MGRTAASDVCTVDATSAQVSAGSGAVVGYKCVITATLSATGYEDGTAPVIFDRCCAGDCLWSRSPDPRL